MKTKTTTLILALYILLFSGALKAQDTLKVTNVEAILYTGKSNNQPLIIGLGGSEGGNAWASDYWKNTRETFIAKGYAFLAIGYFGCIGTPKILDRIAIDEVYKAIKTAQLNQKVNKQKVAIVGGSRGADLALLLASYYKDINCVIAMSPSHAVFPGHTQDFNTSCWKFESNELPFVPVNDPAVPFLIKGDLRSAFEAMLLDTIAEQRSLIKVEKINGPILLLTGKADEIIPSTAMAEKMVSKLKANKFNFPYQHIAFEGSHAEPTKHFDLIFEFLHKNFLNNQQN